MCSCCFVRMVWPTTKLMLCLWHVRKAWAKNIVQKIKDPELRLQILKGIARVMYSTGQAIGATAVDQAKKKLKDLK